MSSPRYFEITYRIKNTSRPPQKIVIQATDAGTASLIFSQQNPGCTISSYPREVQR